MKYHHLLAVAGSLLVGTSFADSAIPEPTETVPPPPSAFQIMSPEEVAAHKDKMLSLSGQEREDYRNEEYQKLVIRARNNGYLLPGIPPWKTRPASEPSHLERQKAFEDRMQTKRESVQKERAAHRKAMDEKYSAMQASGPVITDTAADSPGKEYRKAMKARFDRYMNDRQRHIQKMDDLTRAQQEGQGLAQQRQQEIQVQNQRAQQEQAKAVQDAATPGQGQAGPWNQRPGYPAPYQPSYYGRPYYPQPYPYGPESMRR